MRDERTPDDSFFVILNAHWDGLDWVLPDGRFAERWTLVLDTAIPEPFPDPGSVLPLKAGTSYRVEGRSIVVLVRS